MVIHKKMTDFKKTYPQEFKLIIGIEDPEMLAKDIHPDTDLVGLGFDRLVERAVPYNDFGWNYLKPLMLQNIQKIFNEVIGDKTSMNVGSIKEAIHPAANDPVLDGDGDGGSKRIIIGPTSPSATSITTGKFVYFAPKGYPFEWFDSATCTTYPNKITLFNNDVKTKFSKHMNSLGGDLFLWDNVKIYVIHVPDDDTEAKVIYDRFEQARTRMLLEFENQSVTGRSNAEICMERDTEYKKTAEDLYAHLRLESKRARTSDHHQIT